MNIETASREELQVYKDYLLAELGQESTPTELWLVGVSLADYTAMREYMKRRLEAVNAQLLKV